MTFFRISDLSSKDRLRYKCGSLLDAKEPYIGHGANCRCVMGAGVALQLRNRWPAIFSADCAHGTFDPLRHVPGNFSYAVDCDGKIVINLYTQMDLGKCARTKWIEESLTAAYTHFSNFGKNSVSLALPRIGCGIGGLRWPDVEQSILRVLDGCPLMEITIYDL